MSFGIFSRELDYLHHETFAVFNKLFQVYFVTFLRKSCDRLTGTSSMSIILFAYALAKHPCFDHTVLLVYCRKQKVEHQQEQLNLSFFWHFISLILTKANLHIHAHISVHAGERQRKFPLSSLFHFFTAFWRQCTVHSGECPWPRSRNSLPTSTKPCIRLCRHF